MFRHLFKNYFPLMADVSPVSKSYTQPFSGERAKMERTGGGIPPRPAEGGQAERSNFPFPPSLKLWRAGKMGSSNFNN